MKIKKRVCSTIVCGLLLFSSGLTQAKDSLTFSGAGKDVGQLDPHLSTKSHDKILFGMMFNGLVRFKPGSMDPKQIEPDLATHWKVSNQGLVWTFYLRKGVQFHNGYGELTADDVVGSLKRAANPEVSAVSSDYNSIESIEAIDPYTVKITLKSAVPYFLGVVANYHGGNIVSMKAVKELGDKGFKSNPVGTGPYAFSEYKTKQYVKLDAHDNYFRGAPKIKSLTYRYVPSDSSRELAYSKGELDLFQGKREIVWVNRMGKKSDVKLDVFEPGELRTLHLNTTVKPLSDLRVRQAIAHALDRDMLRNFVGKELTRTAWSPVPNGYLGHSSDIQKYPHNIEKAKQLLAEAGYPEGFSIKMVSTKLPALLNPLQVIQEQLKRVGIKLEIETVEHSSWHAKIRKDESPIVLYGAARFPVADTYLSQFYHSNSIVATPKAVTNFSHCNVADEAIEKARVEQNPEIQDKYSQEAQNKIMEHVCSVPLFETLQVWARHPKLDYGYKLEGSLNTGPIITEKTTILP